MNYIKEMASKQDSLNELTVKGWITKGLNYRRALRLEAAEAMESTPWKWWKHGTMDEANVAIEGVDMMHFALSIAITDGFEGMQWLDKQLKEVFELRSKVNDEAKIPVIQKSLDKIMYLSHEENINDGGAPDIIVEIAGVMRTLGFTYAEMYKTFFGKAVLNEFRQNNGYKDKTYLKEWDGKEDNVFMQSAIKSLEVSSHFEDELYAALEAKYAEVKSEAV